MILFWLILAKLNSISANSSLTPFMLSQAQVALRWTHWAQIEAWTWHQPEKNLNYQAWVHSKIKGAFGIWLLEFKLMFNLNKLNLN